MSGASNGGGVSGTPSTHESALRLAREMIEEIPAAELPHSGLLLLSLALIALDNQLRLAENALRAIVRNADCYGYDTRPSDYVRGLQEAADVARRYEAAADGVFV